MGTLVSPDGERTIDTENFSPADFNQYTAMGWFTEEQHAAEAAAAEQAEAERIAHLEALEAAQVATVPPADEGYEPWTVDRLKGEISTRNEHRDDDAKVSSTGNKPDLIAALEADDEAIAQQAAGDQTATDQTSVTTPEASPTD